MLSIGKVSASRTLKATGGLSPLTQGILLQIMWGTPFHELQSFFVFNGKAANKCLKSNMACLPLFSTILVNRDYIDHCT